MSRISEIGVWKLCAQNAMTFQKMTEESSDQRFQSYISSPISLCHPLGLIPSDSRNMWNFLGRGDKLRIVTSLGSVFGAPFNGALSTDVYWRNNLAKLIYARGERSAVSRLRLRQHARGSVRYRQTAATDIAIFVTRSRVLPAGGIIARICGLSLSLSLLFVQAAPEFALLRRSANSQLTCDFFGKLHRQLTFFNQSRSLRET